MIQKKIAKTSLQYLEERYGNNKGNNRHVDNLLARLQLDVNFFQQDTETLLRANENTLVGYQRIYLELLEQQRKLLHEMNRRTEFDEALIRKYFALIDLEEFKTREKLLQET
jgi:monovalent cation/hydrogen antiporter